MALHFLADEAATARPGDTLVLTGAEAHHAATVRRVRPGEQVTVGDGRGTWLTGVCASAAPREVIVEVTARRDEPAPQTRLVLVQALAKGDRDELAIQAATELGVDGIVPWQAARSVSRWDGPKRDKGLARWRMIAREAAKQAHRAWLPEVEPVVGTADLVRRAASTRVLVLEPTAADALTGIEQTDDAECLLVVGPEGGIAAEELASLTAAGARAVRLGDTVLRTSTAGPAAVAVMSARLGRW
ncbi:16S rRNA (uracil(1498)-N(3))-methyltransferase [Microbacterium thalassium]|uniref:Ribosomal RNA small subunit methyltransferase E n=1 Tax=Microbacterium thalassium TaxID=362649 RepID=A0A7X0FRY9_9MICO|nr:16S rRNA (uracil(1498)-N(3))-methyltransferase [Microbacterium thalassium]MBB6392002.1 16S rRNA (uracil1498-N3)-methyltransferase [Microbacterium thalassium]GLK24022.1 ribosomal RNA small subunit methyltransferase E [Microbacterium thalassium]